MTHRSVRDVVGLAVVLGLAGCSGAASPSASTARPVPRQPSLAVPAGGQPIGSPHGGTSACALVPAGWTAARLAAEVLTISAEDTELSAAAAGVADGAGAVLLFGDGGPADLARQIAGLEAHAPNGPVPLVMTDEEGGGIQRVAPLVGSLPWPRDDALAMRPPALRARVHRVAVRMRRLGITMDLAPVLDLDDGPGPDATHPDGKRSFSIDAGTASLYGGAFERGLMAGGVIPVVKHFPGLGTADNNTDTGRATIAPLATLLAADVVPFRAAIQDGVPAVMMSNAVMAGGPNRPVVVRRSIVTGLLRHRLGFRGLIVTDSLTAGALRAAGDSAGQAAVAALKAGVDLIIDGNLGATDDAAVFRRTVEAIVAAVRAGDLPLRRLRAEATLVRAAQSGLPCLRQVMAR